MYHGVCVDDKGWILLAENNYLEDKVLDTSRDSKNPLESFVFS